MNQRWAVRTARAGTWVASLVFVLWAVLVVNVAWTLASQPAGDIDVVIAQGELLASALSLVLQPLLFVATAVTARATMNTVREMRDARIQAQRLEELRRVDLERQSVRDDAWRLIGNMYAIAGGAGAIGGGLAAGWLGRLRRSVEEPLMQTALGMADRVADAVAAAERLIDAPGPWRRPAEHLRDIAVALGAAMADAGRSQALAARVPDAIDALRAALPGRTPTA